MCRQRRSPTLGFVQPSGHFPGHAFISYVREDSGNVDWLQWTLESAGIRVWRDTADLWPGEDWRAKVLQAITADALVFVACFSRNSLARNVSYQNEELILAIEVVSRHQRRWIRWNAMVNADLLLLNGACKQGAAELLQTTEVSGGTASYLEQVLGLRQASRRDEIEARMPNPDEAAFFQLSGDGQVPVLEVTRIALDGNGSPIRMTVTLFPSDRNRVNYEEDQP